MPRGIPKKKTMMVATETVFTAFGDIRGGERFAADHDLVRRYPAYFQAVEVDAPLVEAATAAPGEERGE